MKSIELMIRHDYYHMNSECNMMNIIELCNDYVKSTRYKYRKQYFKHGNDNSHSDS